MPVMLQCLSHTPVYGSVDPAPGVQAEVDAMLADARAEVKTFDPELIVLFAPDHYNGFFYNLMPPFCIGTQAAAVGDYGSSAGPLPVPEAEALACAAACHAQGVDVAVSRAMIVDHGFAQPLDLLCGGIDRYPVIPVFINAVGAPVAPIGRSRALGSAVGAFLARSDPARRVLVVASGGLSHDPPIPRLDTAPPEVRAALVAGVARDVSAQAAHEGRVINAARRFAAVDPDVGGGDCAPLNPEWDRSMLDLLNAGAFETIDAMTDEEITAAGGGSAHEVRTWVAAYACIAAIGFWRARTRYYRAIPHWMAGFAMCCGEACISG